MTDWRQPQQNFFQFQRLSGSNTHEHLLTNKSYISFIETLQLKLSKTTQELENNQLTEITSQTSPPKGMQLQRYASATKHFQENQTGNGLEPFLNRSNSCLNYFQESQEHKMTTLNEDNNIPFLS